MLATLSLPHLSPPTALSLFDSLAAPLVPALLPLDRRQRKLRRKPEILRRHYRALKPMRFPTAARDFLQQLQACNTPA